MKIAEKPTIEVPEELLGLILVDLAHDRNHEDKNVSYVAIPDSTTTPNIAIPGIGVVRNWLQYLVSPMSHGNLITHVS